MSYTEQFLENTLKVKIGRITLKKYLENLMTQLWYDPERFSGKRPFGNSGWEYDIYKSLVKAKVISGKVDKYGDLEEYDHEEAYDLVLHAIVYQMGK